MRCQWLYWPRVVPGAGARRASGAQGRATGAACRRDRSGLSRRYDAGRLGRPPARHPRCHQRGRHPARRRPRRFRPASSPCPGGAVRGGRAGRRQAGAASVGAGRRGRRHRLLPQQARRRRPSAHAAHCPPHPEAGAGVRRPRRVGALFSRIGVAATACPARRRRPAAASDPHRRPGRDRGPSGQRRGRRACGARSGGRHRGHLQAHAGGLSHINGLCASVDADRAGCAGGRDRGAVRPSARLDPDARYLAHAARRQQRRSGGHGAGAGTPARRHRRLHRPGRSVRPAPAGPGGLAPRPAARRAGADLAVDRAVQRLHLPDRRQPGAAGAGRPARPGGRGGAVPGRHAGRRVRRRHALATRPAAVGRSACPGAGLFRGDRGGFAGIPVASVRPAPEERRRCRALFILFSEETQS